MSVRIVLSCAAALAAASSAPTLAAAPELRLESTMFRAGSDSAAAEIGRFTVPENRAKPGGKTLELAFVRFKSTAANPGPPIVYLAGGPGGSGTDAARGSRFPLFMAMRAFGDVIAFDQRGTGMSGPDLQCPNAVSFPLDRAMPREARMPLLVQGMSACAESLRARGHDLSAFNTNESADDLESLRLALGAEKLTLWGISYGTHLAMAAMKRHPDSIERVILAGVEGLDHTNKLPSDQQALIEEIGRLAAADPVVGKVVPDLTGSIRVLLERLGRAPVTVEVVDPRTGEAGKVVVGPFDLQLALAGMLQGPDAFAAMPDLVYRLEQGDWMALALAAAGDRLNQRLNGMTMAMDCASGQSDAWAARIAREAKGALLADAINWPFPEVCAGAGVGDAGAEFRAPLQSSIPSLLISGTLDGRTPPANAEEVLPGLENAQHLVIEGAGHSDPLFLSSPHILECMLAFMRGEKIPVTRLAVEVTPFQAPRKVVALEADALERLTGTYRAGPRELRVVRAGALLFAMLGGRPYALRPTGATAFFVEGTPALVDFVEGVDGSIARFELRQRAGGEAQVAERVK